jgi:hypothetical protein
MFICLNYWCLSQSWHTSAYMQCSPFYLFVVGLDQSFQFRFHQYCGFPPLLFLPCGANLRFDNVLNPCDLDGVEL